MAIDVNLKIEDCIKQNKNFILEAGAGAGKTYTLIKTLNFLSKSDVCIKNKKDKNILCITYTNSAKDEINSRLKNKKNISIMTLHEFLWSFIASFQLDMKSIILNMIEDKKQDITKKVQSCNKILSSPKKNTNIEKKKQELANYTKKLSKLENHKLDKNSIQYKNYTSIENGIISHDEIIYISKELFTNEYFCNLFIDTFSHVFIDEYQDTDQSIMKIFLDSINRNKKEKYFILGLFGDRMQQIYDKGISTVEADKYNFEKIEKPDNYRSCREIINLSNLLRNDGFKQIKKATDIELEKLEFIYNLSLDKYLKLNEEYKGYTKLFLTHSEISKEVGFETISNIFSSEYHQNANDKLLKLEDMFIQFVIDEIIYLIETYKNNEFKPILNSIRLKEFKQNDLEMLDKEINYIIGNTSLSLRLFIEKFIALNVLDYKSYKKLYRIYKDKEKTSFIESLLEIQVKEYINLYGQIKNNQGLYTLHKVKGEEFNHVIVNIRSEQPWTKYNFKNLIEGIESTTKEKTQRLLYVACTRAKKSLVINYITDDNNKEKIKEVKSRVKTLMGEEIIFKVNE
ncbi:MAG: AAA family ATPase [Paeniclostridium sordellii]|nr:AAA family ATPase [Paeniclostridium sordellii]